MSTVSPERQRKRLFAITVIGCMVLLAGLLSTFGLADSVPAAAGIAGLLYMLLLGGGLAAVYFAASVGFGLPLARLLSARSASGETSPDAPWLALALGPALMLWLSHLLGVFGLLSGPKGFWIAWLVCILGVVFLLVRLVTALRHAPNLPAFPRASLLWIAPVALLLVAASNPIGALWSSEARGFDAMSYHLQLPQEWASSAGRIWPLDHNVYSYLPSYFESAFTHLAAMTGAGTPMSAVAGGPPRGLIGGDGHGAIGCQLLHVLFAIASALLTARIVYHLINQCFARVVRSAAAAEAGAIAGAVMLAVPWVLVTASLPYNELAVNALLAGAMLAAISPALSTWPRGITIGLLCGVAMACKPTALFVAVPLAGLLLVIAPASQSAFLRAGWFKSLAAAAVIGMLTIAPFLVRNYAASSNPVFPAATNLFGRGHWTTKPDQVARFNGAHFAGGTLLDRVELLFAPRGEGLATTDRGTLQPRGILHEQWSLFFPAGAVALAVALTSRSSRRAAFILLLGSGAFIAWWLALSHCQSRFLLPLAVPLSVGIGLAIARVLAIGVAGGVAVGGNAGPPGPLSADAADPTESDNRPGFLVRVGVGGWVVAALLLSAHSARLFLSQNRYTRTDGITVALPNLFLPEGTSGRTGERIREELARSSQGERLALMDLLGPEAFINLALPPGAKVYLLGDSTPMFYSRPVLYHTTYDESPLGRAMRRTPGNAEQWTRDFRKAGIDHVLVNYGELTRLNVSGWYDPDVTPPAVVAWIREWGEPVRDWPDSSHVLFRLKVPPAERQGLVQR